MQKKKKVLILIYY